MSDPRNKRFTLTSTIIVNTAPDHGKDPESSKVTIEYTLTDTNIGAQGDNKV